MPNKYRGARSKIGTSNNMKTGDNGIYGANPAPGLRDYPQSMGKDTIPTKFAESETVGSKVLKNNNQMRTARSSFGEKAKISTKSTIKTGENRYRGIIKRAKIGK